MESLYYFEFCIVILSCGLKKKKKKKKKKKVVAGCLPSIFKCVETGTSK